MALVDSKQISMAAGGFTALPFGRQLGLLFGLAASIALGVYVVLWSQSPEFIPLYASLDPKDTAQVMEALQKNNIAHKYDMAGGGVLVPSGAVDEVRMKLAAQGLPRSANMGFELLDEPQGFGSSQFMESVRYRRSLEGELSRTISSLEGVRNVRVHLGLPKESAFLKRQNVASASVMVELFGGRELDSTQVLGIVNIVSSSVPGLNKEAVTVVDQRGRLLTQNSTTPLAAALDQFNYTRQLEAVYSKRIQELLRPILGDNNVRAEVTADLDFTMSEEMEEKFNPKTTALRSESTINENRALANEAVGIPGALSNQPPALASAPEVNAKTGDSKNDVSGHNSRNQSTRNFEVDKTVMHVKKDVGKLKRLSVAVVVADKTTFDAKGQETKTPWTEQEIERIKGLVKDSIGYSAERGDTVNVVNTPFAQVAPLQPLDPIKFYQQAWFPSVLKQGLAGLFVLLVLFLVLKPILNILAAFKPTYPMKNDDDESILDNVSRKTQKSLSHASGSENQIEQVKQLAQEDPKKVAQVVMNWVGKEDE